MNVTCDWSPCRFSPSCSPVDSSSAASSSRGASSRLRPDARVYELRTYTSPEGRLGDLQARFRNHTVKLFEKHGITSIGYFVPQDAPQSQNTLIYVLAHKDRESAKQNWAAFQKDPDWQAAFKESQKNGPLQTQVQSVFMDPLDFSQLK